MHQLRSISSYLPRGDVILDPLIYEMVLYEYLKMDPDGFLQLVKEWSPDLYTVAAVVNGVLEHLLVHNQRKNVLLEALAILYIHDGKYDKALAMYLKLRHKDVFQLIQKYQLYNSVYDMIEGLMDLDTERAIQFFLEKDRVPSDVVVQKLQHNHRYLYLVMDWYNAYVLHMRNAYIYKKYLTYRNPTVCNVRNFFNYFIFLKY